MNMQFELTTDKRKEIDKGRAVTPNEIEFIEASYVKLDNSKMYFNLSHTVHAQSFIEMNKNNYPN